MRLRRREAFTIIVAPARMRGFSSLPPRPARARYVQCGGERRRGEAHRESESIWLPSEPATLKVAGATRKKAR